MSSLKEQQPKTEAKWLIDWMSGVATPWTTYRERPEEGGQVTLEHNLAIWTVLNSEHLMERTGT